MFGQSDDGSVILFLGGRSVVNLTLDRSGSRLVDPSVVWSVGRAVGSPVCRSSDVRSFSSSVSQSFDQPIVRSYCWSIVMSFSPSIGQPVCRSVIGQSVVRSVIPLGSRSNIRSVRRMFRRYFGQCFRHYFVQFFEQSVGRSVVLSVGQMFFRLVCHSVVIWSFSQLYSVARTFRNSFLQSFDWSICHHQIGRNYFGAVSRSFDQSVGHSDGRQSFSRSVSI